MSHKLNSILLVDDDEATNFLHSRVIEQTGLVRQIIIKQTGEDALNYLMTKEDDKYPQPELILLDINMPVMNGWEFLEAYKMLPQKQKGNIVIVLLTTSINPDDELKSKEIGVVDGFKNKPLTEQLFTTMVEEYFKSQVVY